MVCEMDDWSMFSVFQMTGEVLPVDAPALSVLLHWLPGWARIGSGILPTMAMHRWGIRVGVEEREPPTLWRNWPWSMPWTGGSGERVMLRILFDGARHVERNTINRYRRQ